MLTLTERKPKFTNYQANVAYLRSICGDEKFVFVNILDQCVSIAFIERAIEGNYVDLYTPIGFQAVLGDGLWAKYIDEIKRLMFEYDVVSCFIQTKNSISVEIVDSSIDLKRYRTNYYFNLTEDIDIIWRRQYKDCRYRLKKVIRSIDVNVTHDSTLEDFFDNYQRISFEKKFPVSYQHSMNNFKDLLYHNDVRYIELISDGLFVAGGFYAIDRGDVDYLYGANAVTFNDSIRLLIWESVKYFKNEGRGKLYLGGGISEDDSLSRFKLRFGTREAKCNTIRMITNRHKAAMYMNSQVSSSWYSGYFPPYR